MATPTRKTTSSYIVRLAVMHQFEFQIGGGGSPTRFTTLDLKHENPEDAAATKAGVSLALKAHDERRLKEYMQEAVQQIADGVHLYGYYSDGEIVSVAGPIYQEKTIVETKLD